MVKILCPHTFLVLRWKIKSKGNIATKEIYVTHREVDNVFF